MNSTANTSTLVGMQYLGDTPHIVFNIVCIVLYIVIIVIAAVGNLLVCIAFLVSSVLRRSATNYFIFSLALSDFLTATMCVPFDVNQTLTNWRWEHGSFLCSLWTTVYLIAVPSSILSLLALSVDRYKALSDPLNRFRQTRFMTRKRACIIIAILWVYSFVFAVLPELGWNLYDENVMDGVCYFNTPPKYSVLNSILNFVVPVCIMCALYARIYRIARKLKSNRPRLINADSSFSSEAHQKRVNTCIKKKIKTTKNILLVVCTFFFCWMPFTSFSVISMFCRECYNTAPAELSTVFLILGYSNSAMNPFLYAFRNRKFKDTFAHLEKRFQIRRSQRSTTRRSQTNPTTPTRLSDSHMDFNAILNSINTT